MAISTPLLGGTLPASVVESVGDPEGTRTVTSIIVLLVALGIALVMVAVWLWRATRPDPELLAPLEVMGERKWRRADPVWQRRRLDEVRPEDAEPLDPSAAPPELDEAFDAGPAASGFDDLRDDADAATAPEPADADGTRRDDEAAPSLPPPAPSPFAPPHATPDPSLAPPSGRPAGSPTPPQLDRPFVDDLPDIEIDDDALAAAMAEIDAELAERRQTGSE